MMKVVKITLPLGEIPVNGKQVTFVAPCECTETEALEIEGERYTVVDSLGKCVTGKGGMWVEGATVSVLLDTENKRAFLLNTKDESEPVGTIKTTARTDLDDSWLLCNGDEISKHDYCELGEMFPTLIKSWTTADLWGGDKNYANINCITYANGYWVVGGRYYDGSTYYARIAYTADLTGEWITKDVWTGNTSYVAVNCITYADGYWAIGGSCSDSSGYYARIAYTADLTGEWITKDVWISNNGNAVINCITYANGYWVVGGCDYASSTYYARIAYTADLTGEWITKDVWTGSMGGSYGKGAVINCITYANGYWVVGGQYYASSVCAQIAYTTDLTGEWVTKVVWSGNYSIINDITYANGYWAVCGRYNCGYARIAYTTDLVGSWAYRDLWSSDNTKSYIAYASCIIYADGYWMVGGRGDNSDSGSYAFVNYATDLAGTWKSTTAWSGNYNGNCDAIDIIHVDDCWAVAGVYYYYSTPYYARIAYMEANTFELPTISPDSSYAYIKAKED